MNAAPESTALDAAAAASPADDLLRDALRQRLRGLLDAPLTARGLIEVEQLARLGRQILAVGGDALGATEAISSPYGATLGGMLGGPYTMQGPQVGSETFAVTAIREAVGVYMEHQRQLRAPRLPELMEALATAKAEGITSLAETLEAEVRALVGRSDRASEEEVAAEETLVGTAIAMTKQPIMSVNAAILPILNGEV